jgi:hypothetical protein
LMDQVKIAQGRLLVRHPLEQNAFGNDLVGRRNAAAQIALCAPCRFRVEVLPASIDLDQGLPSQAADRACVMPLMRNDLWVLLAVVGLIIAICGAFYILATLD